MELEEKIENLIGPTVEKAGYELLEVKIGFQKRNQILTIIIRKAGGLSVEDCAKVSRMVEPILDGSDLIKGRYLLRVSSPGIKE